jgi:hypothetical protein
LALEKNPSDTDALFNWCGWGRVVPLRGNKLDWNQRIPK